MSKSGFIIGIIIVVIGFAFVIKSSELLEYERDIPTYNFEISTNFTEKNFTFDDNHVLKNFLLFYDFTKNQGNVSLFFNFENSSLNEIKLVIPEADNRTIQEEILACERSGSNCTVDETYPANYSKDLSSYYDNFYEQWQTKLIISNFSKSLVNNKVVINFKSNLTPSAIFGIVHTRNKLSYRDYAFEFKLADKYQCLGKCVIDIDGVAIEYRKSSVADLKIYFIELDNRQHHRVKLETINRDILFLKNFFLALGPTLLGAGFVLLIESTFKTTKYILIKPIRPKPRKR